MSVTARPTAEGFEMCPLPGSEAGQENEWMTRLLSP